MADKYLRTSDGSDTDDGSTWALAKSTFGGLLSVGAAGDSLYFDRNSTSTVAATTTYAIPGTIAAPIKVVSVSSSGDPLPPTLAQMGGVVETSGASSLTVNGSAYFYGMTFRAGVGSNSSSVTFRFNTTDGHYQKFDNCVLQTSSTGSGVNIDFGTNSSSVENFTELKNTSMIFASVGHRIRAYTKFRWDGGEIAAGSAAITGLFNYGSMGVDARITGVDLSRAAATLNLIETAFNQYGQIVFRNCKLPTNWTGKLIGGDPLHAGFRAIMHNCSAGSTVYPMWEEDLCGKALYESNIVKTAGANNGTPFSWKVTTSTSSSFPTLAFQTPELPAKWNTTVGTPITVSVDILTDSVSELMNHDVWLDVQYLGATDSKTTFSSSAKVVLATATAIPASTATWTTTGMSSPRTQRISVTFTPQKEGFIQGRVCVAKPSTTVFIDPKFMVS